MTTSQPINDVNETKDCQIVLENVSPKLQVQFNIKPSQPNDGKMKVRRQSLRLSHKARPCMKETYTPKFNQVKKKGRKLILDAKQHKSKDCTVGGDISDSKNDPQQNNFGEQFPDLSNLDIDQLIYQMTCFVENGSFDGQFLGDINLNLINSVASDLELPPISSNSVLSTTHVDSPGESGTVDETFEQDETGALDLSLKKVKSTNSSVTPTNDTDQMDISNRTYISNSSDEQNSICPLAASISTASFLHSACASTGSMHYFNLDSPATIISESRKEIENATNVNSIQTAEVPINSIQTNVGCEPEKRKLNDEAKQVKSNQIFIQNYDLTNCSVNRKAFNFKIPKLKRPTNKNDPKETTSKVDVVGSNKKSHFTLSLAHNSETPLISKNPSSSTVSTQTKPLEPLSFSPNVLPISEPMISKPEVALPPPSLSFLLRHNNNFALMKKRVIKLLGRPCFKFFQNDDCGLRCPYNHLLPSPATIAQNIMDWPNELIHFFYLTTLQQNVMCYIMYFSVICNIFVERRLVDSLLAAVEDCERLSLEHNFFKQIFMGLIQCGLNPDESLYMISTHANRSLTSIQIILEIICSYHLRNFKHTVALISTKIEKHDINAVLANEILRQACEERYLSVVLRDFCLSIIRKSLANGTINRKYLEVFLLKILT